MVEFDVGAAWPLDDAESPAPSPDVVGFAGDHLTHGLALGVLELSLLFLDPGQALDDGEPHPVLAEVTGG